MSCRNGDADARQQWLCAACSLSGLMDRRCNSCCWGWEQQDCPVCLHAVSDCRHVLSCTRIRARARTRTHARKRYSNAHAPTRAYTHTPKHARTCTRTRTRTCTQLDLGVSVQVFAAKQILLVPKLLGQTQALKAIELYQNSFMFWG